MPLIPCLHCDNEIAIDPPAPDPLDPITIECPKCHGRTITGKENEVRRTWEIFESRKFPVVTAARCIGLAKGIYDLANRGHGSFDLTAVENKLAKKGRAVGSIVNYWPIKGRTHGGQTDGSIVAAVVVIRNGDDEPKRHSIFVVFRGSVGDHNDGNAGWSTSNANINVDWRANFDNQMNECGYGPSNIHIHGGYREITESYRGRVFQKLCEARRLYDNNHTVITGHSQGGGHTVLFSHWLSYVDGGNPVVCMPYSMPRVGNYTFALDFTNRITERAVYLPYDGWWSKSAHLFVLGDDPVVMSQKHASWGRHLNTKGDLDGLLGLVKKGQYASSSEKKRAIRNQPYFHPKGLVKLKSGFVIHEALNHKPERLFDAVLKKVKRN